MLNIIFSINNFILTASTATGNSPQGVTNGTSGSGGGSGGTSVTDVGSSALADVFGYVIGISSSLAVAALAFCIIKYMSAEDGQVAAQYKEEGKQVIIGWILINMLGAIIATAMGLVSEIGV